MSQTALLQPPRSAQQTLDDLHAREHKLFIGIAQIFALLIAQVNELRHKKADPDPFLEVDGALGMYMGASCAVGAGEHKAADEVRLQHARVVARANWHVALAAALAPPCNPSLTELAEIERLADKMAKKHYMRAVLQREQKDLQNKMEAWERERATRPRSRVKQRTTE
jgi:hypothetical protein